MFANTMRPVEMPPPPAGTVPSVVLAVLVHLLLLAALTWGISWNQRSQDLAVEAELWSAVPQQAAPKPVEVAPPPPAAAAAPAPAPHVDAQIALERDRQREARRKQEQEKAVRLEQQRRELALQKERDKQKERERDKARAQLQQQLQQQRERAEAQQAARQQAEREQNIKRMLGQAGSSTNPDASGSAARTSGPSASYAGRIRARIKPNIVYTDDSTGNPVAEVEIRVAPDGTIVGRRLLKASGVKAWDESVLKAIDKTETLPRDTDGQIPSTMVIVFRPKE